MTELRKGDIWEPTTQSGGPARIDEVTETEVKFYPEGGGSLHRAEIEDFKSRFRHVPQDESRRRAQTHRSMLAQGDWFEDGDEPMPAYTNGQLWNGFATPKFEREVVQKGIEDGRLLPENRVSNEGETKQIAFYDEDRDAFVFAVEAGAEPLPEGVDEARVRQAVANGEGDIHVNGLEIQINVEPGADIEVDGETKRVYAVGAFSWTWMEVEPELESKPGM